MSFQNENITQTNGPEMDSLNLDLDGCYVFKSKSHPTECKEFYKFPSNPWLYQLNFETYHLGGDNYTFGLPIIHGKDGQPDRINFTINMRYVGN